MTKARALAVIEEAMAEAMTGLRASLEKALAERDAATLAALAEARPVPMRKSDGPSALTPPTAAERAAVDNAAWAERLTDRVVAAEIRRVRPRRIP